MIKHMIQCNYNKQTNLRGKSKMQIKQQERSKIKQAKNIDKETIFAARTEKVEMTLNTDSALAQGLLIQRLTELYEDPVEASVRETISNGIDAVSVAHSGERPEVKVYTPTNLNPILVVKDNGVGMTYEDLRNVYSKYGASTKAEDLNQIGAYGLGAKAPLSYGNEFTVTSVKDGEKTTIIVAREEMTNYIKIINAEETDEPTGTTVSIPLSNSDIERFKENVERYRGIPLDKDVDLYINDELVVTDDFALLSENVKTYSGNENVTGRVWVKKDKIVQLLSDISVETLKESLKYVIGGWKYDAPTGRNNFYRQDSGIVVELKAGIVGFNSARDAILANDRYTDLENLMVEYISSDDFVNDVTSMVNTLELDTFKKIVSDLINRNRRWLKIENNEFVIDNTQSNSYYRNPVKRSFSLSEFVHDETGFNFNFIVQNVPAIQKKTVVFQESKARHYKSVSNYIMNNVDSYSQFDGSTVSKINNSVDEVFNGLEDGHELGNLMVHLSTFVFDPKQAKDAAITFVTDIVDSDELKKIKAARKAIVRMSIENIGEDAYNSIVIYTEHEKQEIEKMLEGLGIDKTTTLKIATATETLEDVKNFRAKNKTSTRVKQQNLDTSFMKVYKDNNSTPAEISDLDENKANLIIVSKGGYNNGTRLKQMLAWFCNEHNLSENDVDMYTSKGMHTAIDVKILNEATEYVFRDPKSDNAGMSKLYFNTIHKNVADLHAFSNEELQNEDEAFVRLLTGLVSGPADRVSRDLERVLVSAYKLSGAAGRTLPTFPGKRIKEIKAYDNHTFTDMGYYDAWALNDSAATHIVKQISEEKLELAQNLALLMGTVIKNNEGEYSLRYTDGIKSYSYEITKQAYEGDSNINKANAMLIKATTEAYFDYIEEVVKALDKANFKKA